MIHFGKKKNLESNLMFFLLALRKIQFSFSFSIHSLLLNKIQTILINHIKKSSLHFIFIRFKYFRKFFNNRFTTYIYFFLIYFLKFYLADIFNILFLGCLPRLRRANTLFILLIRSLAPSVTIKL